MPSQLCRLVAFATAAVLAPAAFCAQPWDEAFTGAPDAILKGAVAVPSGDAEVVVLLEDHRFAIDSSGRIDSVTRKVYRIVRANAVDEWGSVEQEWEPWHEKRPELRARVITSDGVVHELDQKTVADAPAAESDNLIYSDARVIRAPLPAVSQGSVIEYEVTKRETAPLLAAGEVREIALFANVIEHFHLSIDAAKGTPLQVRTTLLPDSALRRTEAKSGVHIDVDTGRLEPMKDFEFSVPADQPQIPAVRFSTAVSWHAIAAEYQDIINRVTANVDVPQLLRDLGMEKLPKGSTTEVLQFIVTKLDESVRYTGVEFGQAAIIPAAPEEIVKRHYGDCKDKAVLLAILLRAKGVDAHLALLRAGDQADVDAQTPGFGLFNHAIVAIPGEEFRWIDATADKVRVGLLPSSDSGRLALVIDRGTTTLRRIPESQAGENRIIHHIDIRLRDSGKGLMKESIEAYGSFETQLRWMYAGDQQQTRKALERSAKTSFAGASLGEFSVPKEGDFSQPYRITFEAKDSGAAVTDLQQAVVNLSNAFLFEALPFGLISERNPNAPDSRRKHDFTVSEPYRAEVHFLIHPPPGFTCNDLPTTEKTEVSGATYSRSSSKNAEGAISVDYTFELTRTRYSPDDYETLRTNLSKLAEKSGQVVAFSNQAANLMTLGKVEQALQAAEKEATEHPSDALPQARLAGLLMSSGAGEAARVAARKAVELDPKSAAAWLSLGGAYERDSFGRLRTGDWNVVEAEKAIRKALSIDESKIEARTELAILLEYDSAGERYAPGSRLTQAVDVYREALKKGPNTVISNNLTIALMHLGRYSEAEEELNKLNGTLPEQLVLRLALTAVRDGADAAILKFQNTLSAGPDAAALMSGAAMTLFQLREYEPGQELLRAASRFGDPRTSQMYGAFRTVQRYEKTIYPEDDPRGPVQHFLVLAAEHVSKPDDLKQLLSKHADLNRWKERLQAVSARLNPFRAMLRLNGGTSAVLADILIAQSKLETSGGAPAAVAKPASPVRSREGKVMTIEVPSSRPATKGLYMVTVTSQIDTGLVTFFVIREDGKCKLLGTGNGLEALGEMTLDALDAGDLAGAQALLDAVKDKALPLDGRDDKGPAFRYLWAGIAPETRNAVFVRTAAASLLGSYSGSPKALQILQTVAAHPPQYMERDDIRFAICETLERARNWGDLREQARSLLKSRAYGDAGLRFIGLALIHLGQWTELGNVSEARLAATPKQHAALQFAAIAAMGRGDETAAKKYLDRCRDAWYTGPFEDKELRAWNAILSHQVTDELLADLFNGNLLSLTTQAPSYAYTVAMAQVMRGNIEEATRSLAIGLEGDGDDPSGMAWLVETELMRRYRLQDVADQATARVRARPDFDGLDFAALMLTQTAKATQP